jgi:multidrug efflux system outer membrane protein
MDRWNHDGYTGTGLPEPSRDRPVLGHKPTLVYKNPMTNCQKDSNGESMPRRSHAAGRRGCPCARTAAAKALLVCGLVLIVAGCVNLTPEYRRPDLGYPVPATYREAVQAFQPGFSDERWWEIFGDPELNALIDAALVNNWNLKRTAARILETRARWVQVRADQYPEVGIEGTWDRRKVAGRQFQSGETIGTYGVALPAAFEVDLWGRLAGASRAAWNDILEAEENRRTVAQTVVAETITLYFQIESLERRIEIARLSVDAFRRSLEFVQTRYNRGLVPALDVRQARRALAEAEARIPELNRELGVTQHQLATLLGRYPRTGPTRGQPLDYYKELPPPPAGLPADLLQRRPDIRAAEARLKAFNERVGVAKAARFPTITLTGSYGYASEELSRLVRSQNELWNLGAGIFQPLFEAGRRAAGQRAAEARYLQESADYAQAVLDAFAEVESALLTRKMQLERRKRFFKFVKEARATQRVAQDRYIRGLSPYLDVLDAQQTRYLAEERLVLVELAILTNRVNLHRSLGGGWAEPPLVEGPRGGMFFTTFDKDRQ